MSFRLIGFSLFILTSVALAEGRKPAVEDFVGIEVENAEATPQGTEVLFNFEKDINQFEQTKAATIRPKVNTEAPASMLTVVGISLLVALPLFSWLMFIRHLRQKAGIENASNIEVLEKYRKERELAKKAEEKYKKVS